MDRGYQSHDLFDQWQVNDVHFVCIDNRSHRLGKNYRPDYESHSNRGWNPENQRIKSPLLHIALFHDCHLTKPKIFVCRPFPCDLPATSQILIWKTVLEYSRTPDARVSNTSKIKVVDLLLKLSPLKKPDRKLVFHRKDRPLYSFSYKHNNIFI